MFGSDALHAVNAHATHQALRQNSFHRACHQEGLHAHIKQSRGGAGAVIGVQRAEHQVTSERGLHGGVGGFLVADFANHHYVRIMAQDGAQAGSKVQAHLMAHLNLIDASNVVLHRIFHGDGFHFRRDDAAQRCIQRGGLSTSGWTRHQHDSVWTFNQCVPTSFNAGGHAKIAEPGEYGAL